MAEVTINTTGSAVFLKKKFLKNGKKVTRRVVLLMVTYVTHHKLFGNFWSKKNLKLKK